MKGAGGVGDRWQQQGQSTGPPPPPGGQIQIKTHTHSHTLTHTQVFTLEKLKSFHTVDQKYVQ